MWIVKDGLIIRMKDLHLSPEGRSYEGAPVVEGRIIKGKKPDAAANKATEGNGVSAQKILEIRLWSLSSPTTFFSYMEGGQIAAPDKVVVRWVDERGVCFDGLEGGFTNGVHGRMPIDQFLAHYVPSYP